MNISQFIVENENEFYRVFGVKLRHFVTSGIGFDITKFDVEFLKSPSNESMADVIESKYGLDGIRIIRKCIHCPIL